MSVRNVKYIMYGVEVPYDEYIKVSQSDSDDAYEDAFFENYGLEYNEDASYGCISDGMGGRYAIFGAVLDRFDEYEGDQMPSGVFDLKKVFKQYRLSTKRKTDIKVGVENLLGREVKLKKLFINHYF